MATGTGSGLPADEPDSAIGHSVESPPQDGEESTLQQHGGVQASGSTPPAVLIGGVVKTFGGLGSSEGSASASTEQTKTKSKSQQSELVTGHEGAIVKQSEAQSESTSDGTGLEQARQVVSLSDLNGLLDILVAIAGEWELFLIALGVSEGDINQIKVECAQLRGSSKLCLLDGLERWVKSSECPTFGRIIEALNTELITDKPLAAKVYEFARQVSQDKDMSSVLTAVGSPSQPADEPVHHERYDRAQAGAKREELRECFTSLAVRLKDHLKAEYTDEKLPDFLSVFIVKLPPAVKDENEKFFNDKSLEINRSKTFDELFVHLDIYWDYLNYSLLEGIIEAHGTEKMRQEMESYVRDLKEFRRKTKLFVYWQVERHKKGRVPLPGFRQFVTKHSITGESTLEDIENIRLGLGLGQEFHLSKFALDLIDVVDDSGLITWFVPSSTISRLQERLGSLTGLHITDVFYDSSDIPQDPPNPQDSSSLSLPASPHSPEAKHAPSSSDLTPLFHTAAASGDTDTVRKLLKDGVDVNEKRDGQTAVMLAARNDRADIVSILMESGADPNVRDPDNNTPLMLATCEGHTATVRALGTGSIHILSDNSTQRAPELQYNRKEVSAQSQAQMSQVGRQDESTQCAPEVQHECNQTQSPFSKGFLRGVDVLAETEFTYTGTAESFEWKGHGFRLHFPEDALPPNVSACVVSIKAAISGQFKMPEDTELVSGIYCIYCPHKFINAVTLEVQHCSEVASSDDGAQLSFVTAKCTQPNLPYRFRYCKDGVFSEHTSFASVQLTHFSMYGAVRRGRRHCRKNYCSQLYYTERSTASTKVEFIITQNLELHITAINKKFLASSAVAGPCQEVVFTKDEIKLNIPLKGVKVGEGGSIIPLTHPGIRKNQVDCFRPGKMVPSCELLIKRPLGSEIEVYRAKLIGAEEPNTFFSIECYPISVPFKLLRPTASQKPVELDVKTAISNVIKWFELGEQLGLAHDVLDAIEIKDTVHGVSRQRSNMVNTWLRNDPEASWSKLCGALERIGEKALAQDIKRQYIESD